MEKRTTTFHETSEYAQLTTDELLLEIDSSTQGLTSKEAANRLVRYGYNQLQHQKKQNIALEFLRNFIDPLIIVLLVIAVISLLLGETLDSVIVLGMVFMSVIINFFEEHQAGAAAEKLLEKIALNTIVFRDGQETEILANQVVVGDILELNAGDLVPADARVIEAKDFFVNQSSLTGESFPVEKTIEAIKTKNPDLVELSNIIFMGTSVITGTAKAVVIKTGSNTEFGRVAHSLNEERDVNEFTIGVHRFSNFILRIILLFVIFIFLVNALIKQDLIESLLFAIAVAVGLTPEFLPMIMSVNMGKGSVVMAKKGVIVKKLTAIPTFGSMNVLCTDKTGTLTKDKIELVKYVDIFGKDSEEVLLFAYLNSFYQTGMTNPMDEAVKNYKKLSIGEFKKIDEIPYDFDRKRMSVVMTKASKHFIITKGAPEEVLSVASSYQKDNKLHQLSSEIRKNYITMYEELSRQGFRVLALAVKEIAPQADHKFSKVDETDLELIGFIAFLDPVKSNVKTAIDALENMGIEMKVVTGDNELVTQKICIEAGIEVKGILLGHQITHMTDETLAQRAKRTTIFARFSPAQKSRVIQALRRHNNVVGYLGDGINDAPSLKAADVGISVSNAVDVAKESADLILTHKSLNELADGVIEGRKTFGNTMKYVMMGLSSNFGNMFSVLGAVLFLPFLPMLPIQILLNNFLYDISQITIPTDKVDAEYTQKPKRWDLKSIRKFMLIFGPISSVFDFISFGVLYMFFRTDASAFQTGWFMESLATQTLVIHIIRTRKLPFIQSRASIYLLLSTFCVVVVGWVFPYTPLGKTFGFTPLPPAIVLILASITGVYLMTAEIGKRLYYKMTPSHV